jgi:hypothetical protein
MAVPCGDSVIMLLLISLKDKGMPAIKNILIKILAKLLVLKMVSS